jgi:HK97 gp10 family phage protein
MIGVKVVVVNNRVPLLQKLIPAAVDKISLETAVAIEQDVKGGEHAAPYQTGNLRRAYHTVKTGFARYEVGNDVEVAHYAIFVEMGTYKMAPRPHLRPAAEVQRLKHVERVAGAVRAAAAE